MSGVLQRGAGAYVSDAMVLSDAVGDSRSIVGSTARSTAGLISTG
ncbi:Uncharacterised protein [Mycobacteroides abscessus]|nr:Uncharacterised protein [Mycobacteroides abscessus]